MSGYQFIHLETYGFEKRKNSTKKWVIPDVFAEARRQPAASLHVTTPSPPTYYRNNTLLNSGNKLPMVDTLPRLEEIIRERMALSKDSTGRKIRKDAQVLLAGVVSYPVEVIDLNSHVNKYDAWKTDVFKFLEKQFGASKLAVVIEHKDEKFPHLHFYVIPPVSEMGYSIKGFHPGLQAQDIERQRMGKTLSAKDQKKILDVAYCNAMREFQNNFHDAVSVHHGQTRLGPRKRRLTREQWKLEQTQAAALNSAVEQSRIITELNERQTIMMDNQRKNFGNKIISKLLGNTINDPEQPTQRELELQEQVEILQKQNADMKSVIFKQIQESPDHKMIIEINGLKRQNQLLLAQISKLKSEINKYIADSNNILERFLAALPSNIRASIEDWEKKLKSRSNKTNVKNGRNNESVIQNNIKC